MTKYSVLSIPRVHIVSKSQIQIPCTIYHGKWTIVPYLTRILDLSKAFDLIKNDIDCLFHSEVIDICTAQYDSENRLINLMVYL